MASDPASAWAIRLDPLAVSVRPLRLEMVAPARMQVRSRAVYFLGDEEVVVHWEVDLDVQDKAIARRVPLALQRGDDIRPRRIDTAAAALGVQLMIGARSVMCAEPCVFDWTMLRQALR